MRRGRFVFVLGSLAMAGCSLLLSEDLARDSDEAVVRPVAGSLGDGAVARDDALGPGDAGTDAAGDAVVTLDGDAHSLEEALVAAWLFDAVGASIAVDSSDGGHEATLLGNAHIATGGVRGGALVLGAPGDIVRATSLDLGAFPKSGTVMMWLHADVALADSGVQALFDSWDPARSHVFLRTFPGAAPSTVTLQIAMQRSNADAADPYDWARNETLATGAWVHYAFAYDTAANTGAVFRDGVEVARSGSAAGFSPTQQLARIGGGFVGKIDEVRIYSRPLSAAEVDSIL